MHRILSISLLAVAAAAATAQAAATGASGFGISLTPTDARTFTGGYGSFSLLPYTTDVSAQKFTVRTHSSNVNPVARCPGEGTSEVTLVFWAKVEKPEHIRLQDEHWFSNPFVQGFFTVEEGLSTREGGSPKPSLRKRLWNRETGSFNADSPWYPYYKTNLGNHGELNLDGNGAVSIPDILLEEVPERDSQHVGFKYGCYCVNVWANSGFTVIAGGSERHFDNPDNWRDDWGAPMGQAKPEWVGTVAVNKTNRSFGFNICPESADRTVTVVADDPSAKIAIDLAYNPLIQFFGGHLRHLTPGRPYPKNDYSVFKGISDSEYTMVVQRARINQDGTVTTRMDSLLHDCEQWSLETNDPMGNGPVTQEQNPSGTNSVRATFHPRARISVSLAAFSGMTDMPLTVFGDKLYPRWLTNEELCHIRDVDVSVMTERGVMFPFRDNFWYVVATGVRENSETNILSGAVSESVSGAVFDAAVTSAVYSVSYDIYARPGSMLSGTIGANDYTVASTRGIVDGTTVTFTNSGAHQVTVTYDGTVKTNTVSVSLKNFTSGTVSYVSDAPGSWQESCNRVVAEAVYNRPVAQDDEHVFSFKGEDSWNQEVRYKRYRIKRALSRPVNAFVGNSSPTVVSPHCWVGARHYNWFNAGMVTYVGIDEFGNAHTSTVTGVWNPESRAAGGWPPEGYVRWDPRMPNASIISLQDWARHFGGFSEEEISKAGIGDVVVGTFHTAYATNAPLAAVHPSCCPWFLSPSVASNRFGTASVLGMTGSRLTEGNWLVPRLVATRNSFSSFTSPAEFNSITNADTFLNHRLVRPKRVTSASWDYGDIACREAIEHMMYGPGGVNGGQLKPLLLPLIISGDSGNPIYIFPEGKETLVSFHTSTGGGPSLVRGFHILKAFVESMGDTLKVLE